MNPTREQAVEWAREAGIFLHDDGGGWTTVEPIHELFNRFAAFAYTAGRESGLERAAEVCDEQEKRSRESSDKSKRERDRFMYRHCAVTAKWNAAAIRALKGEKE